MPAFQKFSRRHPQIKPKRQTRITVPPAAGPHVKLVFAEMHRQNVTYDEVERRSGVLRTTLKAWRHKNAPGLQTLEAVYGSLGWDFIPIPRATTLPEALSADLSAVAARHSLTMPKAIEGLIAIVSGIHDGLPPPAPPEADKSAPAGGKGE